MKVNVQANTIGRDKASNGGVTCEHATSEMKGQVLWTYHVGVMSYRWKASF